MSDQVNKQTALLIVAYNTNILNLNKTLQSNIITINRSLFITRSNKINQINKLISTYNTTIATLKAQLDQSIKKIKTTTPEPVNITTPVNNKKALVIGNNYTGTSNELYGCIGDAQNISNLLIKNGFNDICFMTDLTDQKSTRANIIIEFTKLLSTSSSGDLLFFFYSGHGTYVRDRNGDEFTGKDQGIISCDSNIILDDELKEIIQTNLKSGVTLISFFDACYSGSVLDLKYQYLDSLHSDNTFINDKELETPGHVIMISGCTDFQTSSDTIVNDTPCGAMSWSFLESLKQKSNCSWSELITNMRKFLKENGYDQIPQLSSGRFMDISVEMCPFSV